MPIDDALDICQAYAGAGEFGIRNKPLEGKEDLFDVPSVEPDAVVADEKRIVFGFAELDTTTVWRDLQCILKEVKQHESHERGVAERPQMGLDIESAIVI